MIDYKTAPYAALALRLALGTMFLAHGLTKVLVFTLAGTAEFFASLGIPGWVAYPVVFAEIGGGVLLILGVYSRWVAVSLMPVLLGASLAHFHNGWSFSNPNGGWEYPVFLFVIALVITLLGDGALALRPSQPQRQI
ncbi:DoxX family protein [Chitinimonas sp. PSY-7]|uniref:DoxX family membrane protein n=1 Tax=Chitinimonas sp. PSY-7 TaxID=3459088 RepID=UPI00403FDCCC